MEHAVPGDDERGESGSDRSPESGAPVVDDQWIEHFPERAPNLGDSLIHHHLDCGPMAIPLPDPVHRYSPNPADSGFVSTSKSLSAVQDLEMGEPVHIYQVQAEGVDVTATLGERSPYPHEQEVAVPRHIPSCDIAGCWAPNGDWVPNPNHGR